MNIGMFSDCYHPSINGVVSAIAALKKELERQGHNVYLFAPYFKDYSEKEKNIFRFFSIPYTFQKEHRMSFPFPLKNFEIIPSLKLDVAHLHTPFPIGMMGMYAARKNKIPAVFTHHTLWEKYVHYFPILPKPIAVKTAIAICRNFANKCRMVIAPSTGVKNTFSLQGVKTKIEVMPSGINYNLFADGNAEKFYRDHPALKNKKILAYCGRLGKEKNMEFLFRAFKIISAKMPDAHFILIGDGPERKNLENYCSELSLQNNTLFAGYLEQNKIADALGAARLFIFASVTETQGLVIQEALAAGCPPVAVRATGVEDAVNDGVDGCLVSANEEEFAEKTLFLLENPHIRNKFSQNGKDIVKEYSIENTAKKTVDIYKEAVNISLKS